MRLRWIGAGLGIVLLTAVAILYAIGSSGSGTSQRRRDTGPTAVATALRHYVSTAPNSETDVETDGRVVKIGCAATGERFAQGHVFQCTIVHSSKTEDVWCVAMAKDSLVTQFRSPAVPCTGFSRPAMNAQ
jgi:hypothetical protein